MMERRLEISAEQDLLTADETSQLTTIPPSSLHEYAVRAEAGLPAMGPPHINLGPRRRRWRRGDVLAWLESRRVS